MRWMRTAMFLAILAGIASGPATFPATAEDGVTAGEIVLGQSCALTGPASSLGEGMRAGLLAAFGEANEAGGVRGRKLRLVSLDDGYEPDRAIANTRKLIEEEKVFLLVGEVGTPTSKAVVPIAEAKKVPFFGPFTGAEFLRNPCRRYVVNVRGSYYQEMEKLTAHLVDAKGLKRIACFYQNDGYGQAGLSGLEIALGKRGLAPCAKGTYERNSLAVKSALLSIRKDKPEAVVMVGAYKPCAEFIRLARKVRMGDVVFCNISFVGTEALRAELGEDGEGCVISQVVNFPWDESLPLVAAYVAAMKKHQPEARVGFVSLEGYMVGKLLVAAAKGVGGELTREAFLDAVDAGGAFDLGGVTLRFGSEDHQGMDQVFLTEIREGKVAPLGD